MTPSAIDFDLHGFVAIRVIDATPAELEAIRRQLGPIEQPFDREPDIVVRFTDAVPADRSIRTLGLSETGWTDDAFLLLQGRQHAPVRIVLPLDLVGQQPAEIVCARGTLGVPHLIALVNLCALGHEILPLHATAFVHRGVGVLITGWAKGGKTETLLAFMERGATYVGDEWIYLDPGTREMYGIPEPMRLWDWHLASVAAYRRRVSAGARARLAATRAAVRGLELGGRSPLPAAARRLIRRALPIARRQLSVQVPPERLFGDRRIVSAPLQRLVLAGTHEDASIVARPAASDTIGERVVFSLDYERADLMALYQQFRFAFPGRRNDLLEQAGDRQRQLVGPVVSGVPAFELLHPYPVHIPALFDALDPVLEC